MGVVVGRLESAAVDVEEDDGGQPPEALIAVHERMIAHDGLQERRRLLLKSRIDLPPPKRCRRTVRRGVEQSQVPHRPDTEVGGQGQKILDIEVLRHLPSRSRTLAYRARTRAEASQTLRS